LDDDDDVIFKILVIFDDYLSAPLSALFLALDGGGRAFGP
jgi:hypothetical protein